jgi:acyl-coenzyme A thioesterase PaaI-like protein
MFTDGVQPSAWHGPSTTYGGSIYGETIEELRKFLAAFAGARPTLEQIAELAAVLKQWTGRLEDCQVAEEEQVYARRADLLGRGQATWPAVTFTAMDDVSLTGRVRFDRFSLGRNGVAHGGVITLLFDEIAGRLAHFGGRDRARTAYLRTDFRAAALIDTDLEISARFISEEGRKRLIQVQLHHGTVLCAEAEILMVALRPGQI